MGVLPSTSRRGSRPGCSHRSPLSPLLVDRRCADPLRRRVKALARLAADDGLIRHQRLREFCVLPRRIAREDTLGRTPRIFRACRPRTGRRSQRNMKAISLRQHGLRRNSKAGETPVQLESTNAQTPPNTEGSKKPESKTSQQFSEPDEICNTSIPGSKPGGAARLFASIDLFPPARQQNRVNVHRTRPTPSHTWRRLKRPYSTFSTVVIFGDRRHATHVTRPCRAPRRHGRYSSPRPRAANNGTGWASEPTPAD